MHRESHPHHRSRRRILAILALTFALVLAMSVVVFAGKSTLGDFVWHDSNANGQKDNGETGINGVVINLYQDGLVGGSPDFVIQPGELISTTTTALVPGNDEPLDDNGYYDFDITGGTVADPEFYFVEIAASNFAPGGALENYVFTGAVLNADPNIANTLPWYQQVSQIQVDINEVDFPFALKGIQVIKTAGTAADGATYYIDAEETVTYTYAVSNTGEVALDLLDTGYGLVDNVCSPVTYVSGDGNDNDLLDVGEEWIYECAQTISIDTTNVVTATGNPVDSDGSDLPGNDAEDTDDAVVDLVSPAIRLAKTVYAGHNAGASCPGSEVVTVNLNSAVTYCFVVTNTGDTYLNTIVISDTTLGIPPAQVVGAPGNSFPLAPNGTATFYYQATATKDLVNTADATGTPTKPNGDPLGVDPVTSPPDDAEVKLNPVPGAIGDFVWYDSNNDGIQDVGEPGIPNVVLELYDITDTLLTTTTTGVDGGYIFPNLAPGSYYVNVVDATVPTGYVLTTGPQSETDPSAVVTLTAGEFYEDVDFGYVKPTNGQAIIGDTVFYDGNGNGVQDPGEPGIPNVTVVATASDNTTYSAITDENGHYLIPVPAGDSYIVGPDPAPSTPTGLTATTPVTQTTPVLVANEQYLDADFGYNSSQLGVIGNQVWFDDTGNNDGIFESALEDGIPGVTVDLWVDDDGSGTLTPGDYIYATVVTDENGQYQFDGLPARKYLVNVSDTANVLDDYIPTIVLNNPSDNYNKAQPYPVNLAAGQTNNTADFGYVPDPGSPPGKGIIGNQLWYETGTSVNGLFEPEKGDIGLAGIVVELLNAQNTVILTQTTGSSGLYAFTSLPAGTYTVRVGDATDYPVNGTILADYIATVLIGGTADNTNKDDAGYSVTLAADEVNMTADFGYTDLSKIGDFIWWDQDGDGIQDPSEPGIQGVTVTLLDSNGNPIPGVPPVVTGPNGEYIFDDLLPGNYIVKVTPPFNGVPSPERTGNGTNDSAFGNDNQVAETLVLGEQNLNIDGGFKFDTRYEIVKVRNTPDPVRVGDPISYTITITNLGTSIITSLPLTDTYDPDFLDYVSAVPAPTSTDEPNGTLFWANLLTGQLGQNASVSVVVEFTGKADTGTDVDNNPNNNPTPPVTINVARSEGGTFDPDGEGGIPPTQPLPPVEDDEPVQIINPTSVMVASAGVSRGGTVANLRWTTASEVEIVGFNILRLVDGDATQLNDALIVAQFAGQSLSGSYEFQDANPAMDARNVYRLEIHMSDGRMEVHGLGVLDMASGQIFLPLVVRQ